MKTFVQYMEDAWGSHEHDQTLITQIETKLLALGTDIQAFNAKLSHGDDAMEQALSHFQRSYQTLVATFRTSVRKNTNNPERGDLPPISSS